MRPRSRATPSPPRPWRSREAVRAHRRSTRGTRNAPNTCPRTRGNSCVRRTEEDGAREVVVSKGVGAGNELCAGFPTLARPLAFTSLPNSSAPTRRTDTSAHATRRHSLVSRERGCVVSGVTHRASWLLAPARACRREGHNVYRCDLAGCSLSALTSLRGCMPRCHPPEWLPRRGAAQTASLLPVCQCEYMYMCMSMQKTTITGKPRRVRAFGRVYG